MAVRSIPVEEVLALYRRGLSFRQIAKALNRVHGTKWQPNSVSSALYRARQQKAIEYATR